MGLKEKRSLRREEREKKNIRPRSGHVKVLTGETRVETDSRVAQEVGAEGQHWGVASPSRRLLPLFSSQLP